jgi:mycothiol synthase
MKDRQIARVKAFEEKDYEELARILTLCIPARLTTAENERRLDEETPVQYRHRRWTAEDNSGVLGFCEYSQNHRTAPDCFMLRLIVDPGQWGRGIETELFEECMVALSELDAREFRVMVNSHEANALAFFTGRGFCVTNTSHRMSLDLSAFRTEDWEQTITAVTGQGYLIRPLFEVLETEGGKVALWRLHQEVSADIPMASSPVEESLDQFCSRVVNRSNLRQDLSCAATFGVALAAVVELVQTPREANLNVSYTGTARAHRNKGVATALKLWSMHAAKNAGINYLTTYNHAENAPILKINESLGFEKNESVLTLSFVVPGDRRVLPQPPQCNP